MGLGVPWLGLWSFHHDTRLFSFEMMREVKWFCPKYVIPFRIYSLCSPLTGMIKLGLISVFSAGNSKQSKGMEIGGLSGFFVVNGK